MFSKQQNCTIWSYFRIKNNFDQYQHALLLRFYHITVSENLMFHFDPGSSYITSKTFLVKKRMTLPKQIECACSWWQMQITTSERDFSRRVSANCFGVQFLWMMDSCRTSTIFRYRASYHVYLLQIARFS